MGRVLEPSGEELCTTEESRMLFRGERDRQN